MAENSNKSAVRYGITLSRELAEKVDINAKKMSISRSAYIALAVSNYTASMDAIERMPELIEIMRKMTELKQLKDQKEIDE